MSPSFPGLCAGNTTKVNVRRVASFRVSGGKYANVGLAIAGIDHPKRRWRAVPEVAFRLPRNVPFRVGFITKTGLSAGAR